MPVMPRVVLSIALVTVVLAGTPAAQTPPVKSPEFDIVSIKRNINGTGCGAQTTPDGGTVLVNQPIRSVIMHDRTGPRDRPHRAAD